MTCKCGSRKDPRSRECKPCAERRRWRAGRTHRSGRNPLAAVLCRCDVPWLDGDGECCKCGHLIDMPDPDEVRSITHVESSSLGKVYTLPNVVHRIGRIAA